MIGNRLVSFRKLLKFRNSCLNCDNKPYFSLPEKIKQISGNSWHCTISGERHNDETSETNESVLQLLEIQRKENKRENVTFCSGFYKMPRWGYGNLGRSGRRRPPLGRRALVEALSMSTDCRRRQDLVEALSTSTSLVERLPTSTTCGRNIVDVDTRQSLVEVLPISTCFVERPLTSTGCGTSNVTTTFYMLVILPKMPMSTQSL